MTAQLRLPSAGRRRVSLLLLCSGLELLLACAASIDNSQVRLPDPVESTTLGPGDVFTMDVVGEPDLPRDFQVASDGSVDFPYVHRLRVQGLEPQEVARAVRERLIAQRILTDPTSVVGAAAPKGLLDQRGRQRRRIGVRGHD